jgi:DNA polymerase III subunit gamma/tau
MPAGASAVAKAPSEDQQFHSLYRRFRPQRFAEVRGQDHITRALRNATRDGRVAHAYLFSGPRGTGKTSTARILAMALNCTDVQDGEPCGVCGSCVEIRRGASVDVHELDAASNRKLDEMRDLLSRVALGTRGRWKIYIIDEVHQLTADAASALLKTLEEPPGHVVFVLATTDPQKVLPTIRSRTLHFEFHLLASEVLGDLLRSVNTQAGLGVTSEAIDLVVRRGHGSARDALTVLDQVAAAGDVEDEVSVVAEIVDGLADRDPARVLVAVAEGMASGRDPRRLAADILDNLRNGFLATMARGLVMLPDDAVARVEEQARRLGPAAIVRAMEGMGDALTAMRDSVDSRVTLEVALVRQARPDMDRSPAALLERVEHLERLVAESNGGRPDLQRPSAAERRGPVPPPRPAEASPAPPAEASPSPPAEASPPPPADRPSPTAKTALGAHRGPVATRGESEAQPSSPPTATQPRSSATQPRSSATPPPADTPPPAAMAPTAALPSRDELTKAWGDGVLRSLPGKARSRFAGGRFLAVEATAAVFAVPDKHLLGRCEETRADTEAALAARFGRPVPIRLVLDPGSQQAGRARGEPPARPEIGDEARTPEPRREPPQDLDEMSFDPATEDLGELVDAAPAIISPEQRLMEAFPGAKEVSP